MRPLFFYFGIFFISITTLAQEGYVFTEEINLQATPVISQGNTGTCWSFSTSSFLESEIIRLSGKNIDLSEMYQVRTTYPKKITNFVMRQGNAQLSEGGLAHDVMASVHQYGLVPQQAYSGLSAEEDSHNHAELMAVLSAMATTYVDNPGKKLSKNWKPAVEAVLDVYLGAPPATFMFEGKEYTPQTFKEMTGIVPQDYVAITSFTQAPFYSQFILNIPDNWSNGSFYNLPVDEMVAVIDHALTNGYTVALDCDVSERSFSAKDGVAVIPYTPENTVKALQGLYPEKKITQEYRQQEFENFTTTDDHLMHITGKLRDQNGNVYYKVKNSWGTDASRNANDGYVFFSEAYIKLKAISVLVHKKAIPAAIATRLKI